MKVMIQDIAEITDSREMLESKPHPFMIRFIYILGILIVVALTWSYFGEIDENIKAHGIVRPNRQISNIRNKITGKVSESYINDGDFVKKGDLLYSLDHSVLDIQKETLEKEYAKAVLDLRNLEKLRLCVIDDRNYFNESVEGEKEYYNKFAKYKTDMELQSREAELGRASLDEVGISLAGLNTLKRSITEGKNFFTAKDSIYYNQYLDYRLNTESLKATVDQRKEYYKSCEELVVVGAVSKSEVNDAKKQLDAAENSLQKYNNEYMMNLNKSIAEYNEKAEQLRINLKKADQYSGSGSESAEASLEKYRIDTIVQIETDIKVQKSNIDKMKLDLESSNSNIEDCNIVSPIDGYVNLYEKVSIGDLVQSGTEIASIIPADNSAYKVQMIVSNSDIANIEAGQEIKYHFLALPYREYGELTGAILNIGTDSKMDQTRGISYYTVEASINNKPLYSYKGNRAEIKVGMECEVQVIVKTKKILYYLLEKINLRD